MPQHQAEKVQGERKESRTGAVTRWGSSSARAHPEDNRTEAVGLFSRRRLSARLRGVRKPPGRRIDDVSGYPRYVS